jgi:hypothetical protein
MREAALVGGIAISSYCRRADRDRRYSKRGCLKIPVIIAIIVERRDRGTAGIITTWAMKLACGHIVERDKWSPSGSWPAPRHAICEACRPMWRAA